MLFSCKEVSLLLALCALPLASAGISWIQGSEVRRRSGGRAALGGVENPKHNEFTLTEVINTQNGMTLSTNYLSYEDILPENLRLHFTLYSTTIAMRLRRSHDVESSFPTLKGRNNNILRHTTGPSQAFGVYYDLMLQASLVVEPQVAPNGTFRRLIRGSFKLANNEYMIEHLSVMTDEVKQAFLNKIYHTYGHRFRRSEQVQPDEYLVVRQDKDEYMPGGQPVYRDIQRQRDEYAKQMERYLQNPISTLQPYTVEVMLVLDYGVFRKWWELATERSASRREDEVVDNLRYYYAHVMNGVNLRYRSIADQINFHVKLAGLYISTTARDSSWTTNRLEYEPGDPWPWVNAYATLDHFELWMQQHNSSLPTHDVGMLFVGYQLFGRNYDRSKRAISGLADIKGVCTKLKGSVNMDRGVSATTLTGAHELGHSLGSNHDGTSNSCSGRDQFIMATSPGALSDKNYLNPFTFSQCSIRAFRNHINYLNLIKKNCLLNEATPNDNTNIDDELRTPPGQRFDINQQCKVINGRDSYYCGGHYNDMMSCRLMECYHPLEAKCVSRIEQVAANGTTCGNRKWCMTNQCVYDELAPPAKDYCRSGDYKGALPDGKTCRDVKGEAAYNCYNTIYKDQCCETCDKIKNGTRPGCSWGDRDPWCKTIFRRDCYGSNVRRTCCDFCDKQSDLTLKDCRYGDRASWCRNIQASSCYVNHFTCCETCSRYKRRSTPECPYGDKASWCPSIPKEQCYTTKNLCCQSCKRHETGRIGCEYGDKSRYCSSVNCKDPYYQRVCCGTCGYYITTRAPPVTVPPVTVESGGMRNRSETQSTSTQSTSTQSTTSVYPPDDPNYEFDTSFREMFQPDSSNSTADCLNRASWCENVFPGRCYTDRDICCRACALYRTYVKGCEYGDRFAWCDSQKKSFCDSKAQNRIDCCATCGQLDKEMPEPTMSSESTTLETTTTPTTTTATTTTTTRPTTTATTTTTTTTTTRPTTTTTKRRSTSTETSTTDSGPLSCPRGDMALWCSNNLYRAVCYSHPGICCDTCNIRYTGMKGCEYGDKASWCDTVSLSSCLHPDGNYNATCCETCERLIAPTRTTTTLKPSTTSTTRSTTTTRPTSTTTASTTTTTTATTTTSTSTQATTTERSTSTGNTTIIDERSKRCEFGNRHNQCHRIKAAYCYYEIYQKDCCKRCEELSSGDPDCPWGDIHDQCDAVDCRDPIQGPMCCETCKRRQETTTTVQPTTVLPPRPECADKASWCGTMPARDCYVDEGVCCPTCKKHYTGIRGCEYQDKVSWCREVVSDVADCDMPNVKNWCCYTCTMLGYFPPEQIHRIREGVVVGVQDSSLQEIIRNVPVMLDYLLTSVNMYCLENIDDCCSFFKMVPRFNPRASGGPFKIDFEVTQPVNGQTMNFKRFNDREIVFFVLVQLTGSNLSPYCTANDTSHRLKRDVTNAVYLNSVTVFEILNRNKFNLEELFHWRVIRIETPSSFYRDGTSDPGKSQRLSKVEPQQNKDQYLLGLVIALAVCLVAVLLGAVLFWIKHKRTVCDNGSVRHLLTSHGSLSRASSISQFSSASSSSSISGSFASYNSKTSIKRMDEISRSLSSLQTTVPKRDRSEGCEQSPMSFREISMLCFENTEIPSDTLPVSQQRSTDVEVKVL